MKITLTVKIVGGKKCLVIPSWYHDLFELGKRYNGFLCTMIGRYHVLLIPPIIEDQFITGKQYEIEVRPSLQA